MKLGLSALVVAAMVASLVTATGCKSSDEKPAGEAPSQGSSAAPATGDPSAQPSNDDDRATRRARWHRGRRHGHGEWRKRRAATQPPGSDGPALPAQP
jgi:hypothetical protein